GIDGYYRVDNIIISITDIVETRYIDVFWQKKNHQNFRKTLNCKDFIKKGLKEERKYGKFYT
ncbi:MAG: hypothetical protein RSE36_08640, partial [Oscillospiraceae bacterium]